MLFLFFTIFQFASLQFGFLLFFILPPLDFLRLAPIVLRTTPNTASTHLLSHILDIFTQNTYARSQCTYNTIHTFRTISFQTAHRGFYLSRNNFFPCFFSWVFLIYFRDEKTIPQKGFQRVPYWTITHILPPYCKPNTQTTVKHAFQKSFFFYVLE